MRPYLPVLTASGRELLHLLGPGPQLGLPLGEGSLQLQPPGRGVRLVAAQEAVHLQHLGENATLSRGLGETREAQSHSEISAVSFLSQSSLISKSVKTHPYTLSPG